MSDFQTFVNNALPIAVEGDFADANPRNALSGQSAPAPRQVSVSRFAWLNEATGVMYGSYEGEASMKMLFVRNDRQSALVDFIASNTLKYPVGLTATGFTDAAIYAKVSAAAATATVGQKVFANYVDGSFYFAATGTSTQTASVTGSIATTGVLTVTAVASGSLNVGDVLTAGGAILSQLSGTPGGVGTYQTTNTTLVASVAIQANGSTESSYIVDLNGATGNLTIISTWA